MFNTKVEANPSNYVSENNITVEDAAKILGCSYPHVINRIKLGKIRAKKNGKSWLVDAEHVSELKKNNTIKPRPSHEKSSVSINIVGEALGKMKTNGSLNQEEVEVTIRLPRAHYQLINLALESGKEKKSLKQHLESVIEEFYNRVQQRISEVNFDV